MRVLGLMSGTSADGIDVALVRLTGRGWRTKARLENFTTVPFPDPVRRAVLRVANANRRRVVSVAEVSQLNFLLGEFFARAAVQACRRFRVSLRKIDLIGSHGQTVYHNPTKEQFAGRRMASTLQLGEPAVIAERTGIPVAADFRPRDMAAGGQGAPLVPYVDYLLYHHRRRSRVALNIGGIANITMIPASASPEDIVAFDTGPGNMLIDAVVERVTRGRQRFDRDGKLAACGQASEPLLAKLLRHPYFRRRPPKSTGREEFGREYAGRFLREAKHLSGPDKVCTAAELTARSIASAVSQHTLGRTRFHDIILGGGGSRNRFLVTRLRELLPGLQFIPAGRLGVHEKAKEAFAFAVLAYQTWQGEPANLPSATGASHPVLLGTLVPGRP